MSVNYTAGVFFGAAVPRRSPLGEKLDEYIDRHGGAPAPSGVEGVEISTAGSEGEEWITVLATGSARSYGRDDGDCPAPVLLTDNQTWRENVRKFLVFAGASPADVGWHFQGSAS